MPSSAITTVVKMLEALPEPVQLQVVERVREYLDDLRDEIRWDEAFAKTQPGLVAAARKAKEEIAAGKAEPLDIDRL